MSIRRWARQQGPLVLAAILFLAVAPLTMITLPLAALLVISPPRSSRATFVAAVAGGFSLAWLAQSGNLPGQLVRSATLISATVFVMSARYTAAPVTHRALLAVMTAALAVGGMLLALGSSWSELRWWVGHRVGFLASQIMGIVWRGREPRTTQGGPTPQELADLGVRLMADYYPAILALALMAGLGIATAIYHRVAMRPFGTPVGRLREFRFSEHIGWLAVVPLIVVLIPKLAAAKISAINILVVTGTLYALRGVAVAAFGLQLFAGASGLLTVFVIVAAILLLPVAFGGAILLGVVDAGLDLRRRWTTPPAST